MPTCCESCVTTCCCLRIIPRTAVKEELLDKTTTECPSLWQRCFMCQCCRTERTLSGLQDVPQLKGLTGILIENGDHITGGTMTTLKWGKYDATTRTIVKPVAGGWCGSSHTGTWASLLTPLWCFLMNGSRCINYSYKFQFSEDLNRADIYLQVNPLPLCCPCIPCCQCCPAWCTLPKCCVDFEMVRAPDDDGTGSSWLRNNDASKGTPVFYYKLQQVVTPDGQPGPFKDALTLKAPEQLILTY